MLYNNTQKKQNLPYFILLGSVLLTLIVGCVSTVYVPQRTVVKQEVVSPAWAPPYDNADRVRYYYFPDIEVYYDVNRNEFVYLEDGNWVFSPYLPPMYSNYDLNNAFVVIIDYNAYEPWRQHQLYLSHYPRYYYRTVYVNNNQAEAQVARGFNENAKNVIYVRQNNEKAMSRYNNRENEPLRRNEAVDNKEIRNPERRDVNPDNTKKDLKPEVDRRSNENVPFRRENASTENKNAPENGIEKAKTEKHGETEHRTQPAVYNGNTIGKPVKVDKSAVKRNQPKTEQKQEPKKEQKQKNSDQKDDDDKRK